MQKPGKRVFGQRRTVVQLKDEPRRQPTYGFGYKPADEVVKPEGELIFLITEHN